MSVLLFCMLLAIPVAPQTQHAAICEMMLNNFYDVSLLLGWNVSLCPPIYLGVLSDLLICTSGLEGVDCNILNQITSLTLDAPLEGSFPSLIANLNELTRLTVTDASGLLVGPTDQFAALNNLQVLWLNDLQVTGTFPQIGSLQLTTLHLLANDATPNRLSGTIPSSVFANMNMQYLNLRGQNFSGIIPQALLDTTTYTFLDLTDNNGLLSWSLNSSAFVNSPSLKRLYLENVNLAGSIPASLTTLNLQDLYLGNNQLTGTIPDFVCCGLRNFKVNGNFLSGTIPTLFSGGFNFFTFDVSSNGLTGSLPELQANSTPDSTFDQYVKGNCYFNFEQNHLTGPIPPGWPKIPDCTFIFADNLLNGSFPSNWSSVYIDGSRNQFTGTFPYIGPKVRYAFFSDNKFDSIASPYSSTNLSRLDLSANKLTALPLMFLDASVQGTFKFLSVVNFGYNQITGTFPGGEGDENWLLNGNLAEIDLSYNFIVGKYNLNWRCSDTAYCLNPNAPRIIRLVGNRLSSTKYLRETNAFEINHVVNPQDLDDCLAGTHQCAHNCADGWTPVLSYTCSCRTGYALEANGRNCSSICGDGYVTPDEVCDPSVMAYGCTYNCTADEGYTCNGTACYGVCGDGFKTEDEQCDNATQGSQGCDSNCRVVYGWSCLGTGPCKLCVQSPWTANTTLPDSLRHFLWLDQYTALEWMDYYHCPTCSGSFLDQTRTVINDYNCLDFPKVRQGAPCAYSCTNLSADGLGDSKLLILKTELERGNMLYDVLNTLYGIQTTIKFSARKRDDLASGVLSFNFSGCNSSSIMQTAAILQNMTAEIYSGGSSDLLDTITYTTNASSCTVDVANQDIVPAPTVNGLAVGLGVGIGVGLLLLLLLVLVYLYYRRRRAQHPAYLLPKQIQWSFVDYVENSSSWIFGGGDPGFYYKSVQRDSSAWKRIKDLFVQKHGGGELEVTGVKMVFNKTILNSFINNWKITTSRILNTPQIFNKSVEERFQEEPDGNLAKRQYVERKYNEILSLYPWNAKLTVPILSACHGTGEDVADKIAGTGFASLSSLDDGYFGKGIYFTSFAMYTLPYFSLQRKPCIVLSYLVLGNMFPVIEDHKGPQSLLGKGLKGPSHYVVTNRNGRCVTEGEMDVYDEIVLQQDSQAIPAFIITVDRKNFAHLISKWSRELPATPAPTTPNSGQLVMRSGSDETDYKDQSKVDLLI